VTPAPGPKGGPERNPSPFFPKCRRAVVVVWALMALANLSAGVVVASWPERQSDLDTMRRWGRQWLVSGVNVYVTDEDAPDYPPHALVALSPLGTVPAGWAVPAWAAFNLALAVAAPYLAVRTVCPTATLSGAALPMAMFLCWGGFRTLLQFGLLSLTLGLLAMVLADKRPRWAGVCLGLALMKPQIAAPFFLWALFTRRLRIAAVAAAVVMAGFAVFCLRAHANPVSFVLRYAAILQMFYTGDAIMVGLSQLRPLIVLAVPSTAVADAIAATIALVMLGGICVLGFREARRRDLIMYSAPSLAALWSLLTFYHLTYGFLLLLPTAALLIYADDPRTSTFRLRVFWFLQLVLMVDVPGAWRRFGHYLGPSEVMSALSIHVDRVLMMVLFACVAALALTTRQAPGVRGGNLGTGQTPP
jgi:hypothetical protein